MTALTNTSASSAGITTGQLRWAAYAGSWNQTVSSSQSRLSSPERRSRVAERAVEVDLGHGLGRLPRASAGGRAAMALQVARDGGSPRADGLEVVLDATGVEQVDRSGRHRESTFREELR